MPKTVTIQVPDDLAQQLGAPADAVEAPLQRMIVKMLTTLAELTRSLKNEDPLVRVNAAKNLGELGIEAAVPALTQALKDEDYLVRVTAIESLKAIGTEESLTVVGQNQFAGDDESSDYEPLRSLSGNLKAEVTDLGENHDLLK